MQTPTLDRSSETLTRLGVYSTSRINADPRTRDLAALLKTRTDDIRQKKREREDAQDRLVDTEAVADAADEGLDLSIKYLADDVYNAAGRSRRSPRYRRIFPKGATPYTQPRLFDQDESTDELLRHLDKLADDPVVAEHRPEIEARHNTLKEALAQYKEAVADVQNAKSAEYLAKSAFIVTYVSTYGSVVEAVGSKGLAEPFFRRFRTRRPRSEAPAAPDATPAVPDETSDSDEPESP